MSRVVQPKIPLHYPKWLLGKNVAVQRNCIQKSEDYDRPEIYKMSQRSKIFERSKSGSGLNSAPHTHVWGYSRDYIFFHLQLIMYSISIVASFPSLNTSMEISVPNRNRFCGHWSEAEWEREVCIYIFLKK